MFPDKFQISGVKICITNIKIEEVVHIIPVHFVILNKDGLWLNFVMMDNIMVRLLN